MAKGVKVVMRSAGAREVLNSPEVMEFMLERAERIRARADSVASGRYDADVQAGRSRAHAMVKTKPGRGSEAAKSRASNAKHNTLLKSLDAGR